MSLFYINRGKRGNKYVNKGGYYVAMRANNGRVASLAGGGCGYKSRLLSHDEDDHVRSKEETKSQ